MSLFPAIIQGGMGVGISGWALAHAVSSAGQLGVVSGTALDAVLERPFVQTLDVTPGVAARYGALFAGLRRNGTPIPVNDIWIAATTLEAGAHLLTFDQDFACMTELPHTVLPTDQ